MSLTNVLLAALLSMTTMSTAAAGPEPPGLEPCPKTPNCVSTQATRAGQRMEPIPFHGDLESARARLLAVLELEPRVQIEEIQDRLVRTVFTTRIIRFKDDVVFVFASDESVIHFRSASRIGRSDWGANRRRMERLSAAFRQAEANEEASR